MPPPRPAAELESLVAELARLETEHPHGSAARTPGIDAYIRSRRAQVEALQRASKTGRESRDPPRPAAGREELEKPAGY